MYKSPITIICSELKTQMVQEEEKMIMKGIRDVGINVDKEELMKAIQYDSNQYTKGYEEGRKEVLDKIRAEIEGLTYYWCEINPKAVINDVLEIIDKYRK